MFQIWYKLVKGSKNGQNIVVKEYLSKMALDIIGELSFGYSFNSQETELNPLLAVAVKNSEGVVSPKSRLILRLLPFMWYMPFGPSSTLKELTNITAKVLDEVQVLVYTFVLLVDTYGSTFYGDMQHLVRMFLRTLVKVYFVYYSERHISKSVTYFWKYHNMRKFML